MKREMDRQAIVWGGLLVLVGGMLLIQTFTDIGAWIWVAVLAVAGLGVYAAYAVDRKQKWMLIVSYVFLAIALLIALLTLEVLTDSFVATFVLGSIAIPFLYVYLRNRTEWWWLVPSYALVAIGVMVPLIETGILEDEIVPAYVFLAIGLPFFVVYLRNPKNWWALIPGGIMALMAMAFLLASDTAQFIVPVVLIIVGAVVLGRQFIGAKAAPGEGDSEG
ncbi:MAG: hypothetical protein P8Z34_01900 [Anaerolineales bacterium]|jgi:hypothetical protein